MKVTTVGSTIAIVCADTITHLKAAFLYALPPEGSGKVTVQVMGGVKHAGLATLTPPPLAALKLPKQASGFEPQHMLCFVTALFAHSFFCCGFGRL